MPPETSDANITVTQSESSDQNWLAGDPPATSNDDWGASQAGTWTPPPTGWGSSTHHELRSDFGRVESDHLDHLKAPGWTRVQRKLEHVLRLR